MFHNPHVIAKGITDKESRDVNNCVSIIMGFELLQDIAVALAIALLGHLVEKKAPSGASLFKVESL